MNVYLGIDPGDKWVGWARMQVTDRTYTCCMGVYNRAMFNDLTRLVNVIMEANTPSHVICESFQLRALGHNKFGRGETLRLIGALQYATGQAQLAWSEVPPGNAVVELGQLHLGKYIEKWMKWVPASADTNWRHAHSAWRVIGRYLLTMHHKDITRLARTPKNPPMGFYHGATNALNAKHAHLLAPTASWTV